MTGPEGEEIAADFLKKRGYRILERNFKTSLGEVDLIAREGKTLVFVEVKARAGETFGPPQSAVDIRKQTKISRVALSYLSNMKIEACSCRFDVVAVLKKPDGIQVELFRNAFELPDGVGC